MTVTELIQVLKNYPPDLQVAYCLYSEQALLSETDIKLADKCQPRSDGWVHDARPDKPKQTYVLLPGN
jgi:hypothetical protein